MARPAAIRISSAKIYGATKNVKKKKKKLPFSLSDSFQLTTVTGKHMKRNIALNKLWTINIAREKIMLIIQVKSKAVGAFDRLN